MIAAALILPALAANAGAQQVGDTYEIAWDKKTTNQSEGSSGSTSNRNSLVERVIAVRDDGVELEYDVSQHPSAEERAQNWQFPARVFKPLHGPVRLLNAAELEGRVDGWLKHGGMTRAACGHWIFTWNAFRIECDPQSVTKTIESLQLEPEDLRDGAPFSIAGARGSAPLTRKNARSFVVELAVDADAVRRERADTDVVVAEVSGKTLAPDAALRAHADEAISGTVTVTFDLDETGRVRRRTKSAKFEIRKPGEPVENHTATEILERKPVAKPPADPRLI